MATALGCASTSKQEATGEYVDDTVITGKVKAAIFEEPSLKSAEINVETFKGVVQLSGLVLSGGGAAVAQSVQYRSPAGVEYRSLPDTGAIARAERALAADPKNVDLIIALGVAQSGAQQFREAIATFTKGLAIAPGNATLYRWRGHRYLSVADFDRAMADLTRGYGIDSLNYGVLYTSASCGSRGGTSTRPPMLSGARCRCTRTRASWPDPPTGNGWR